MDIGEIEARIPTVSEINEQLVDFIKDYVKRKVSDALTRVASQENLPRDKLMMHIQDIDFDDISSTISSTRRPRKKVDSKNRCLAKTSTGGRCTRKRKDTKYCGGHEVSRRFGEAISSDEGELELNGPKKKPLIKVKIIEQEDIEE